ncbi:hypothetical protein ACFV4K_32095 [Nocardia sp. NPDC059764]|uniref:hypothetical protein n=1 Tax=Nocardia sp. NPDC059764 TaxID=3346939 RepID=UPI0036656BAE
MAGLAFGLLTGLSSALQYSVMSGYSDDVRHPLGVEVGMICRPIAALLLIPGGILLLRRLTVGRVLVILGVVPLFVEDVFDWYRLPPRNIEGLGVALFPLALYLGVAVLASLPSVTRWVAARR